MDISEKVTTLIGTEATATAGEPREARLSQAAPQRRARGERGQAQCTRLVHFSQCACVAQEPRSVCVCCSESGTVDPAPRDHSRAGFAIYTQTPHTTHTHTHTGVAHPSVAMRRLQFVTRVPLSSSSQRSRKDMGLASGRKCKASCHSDSASCHF